MQADRHEPICRIVDKSLVGALSDQEQQSLREHLIGCAPCRAYLDDCSRAIAGLDGFRFDINPGLERKVLASLALRSQQLEARQIHRKRLWRSGAAAFVLAVAGCFAASQLVDLAATVFHIELSQVQLGLMAFWIAPSACFLLLFPLLPLLMNGRANQEGSSL
jgi:hypothetical protein